MRIDRIRVDGFGRLVGLDTGGDPLGSLVVVRGPNEAGKSTLFTFLTTALYGFAPATRDRNPHVPWGMDEAGGRLRLSLDGGGCAEVERRLRSQPASRLTLDGVATDLRNQPLPWVEHVPRTVFRQVFAVTLADLASLDSETWGRIQDKVVGTMGASDLRSARAEAEALEAEAGEIWRPSRRGNQRLRDLQAAARALRTRRVEALERDGRVRALVEEADRTLGSLAEAREEKQRVRLSLERTQTLLPIRRQRERIASLRGEGGDRTLLAALPADPPARFGQLLDERARLGERLRELETGLGEQRSTAQAFDDGARRLIGRREEVARLVGRAAACAAERSRATELEAAVVGMEAELDTVGASVFAGTWREIEPGQIESVPLDLLRIQIARARPSSAPARSAQRQRPATGLHLAGVIAGAALLVWGGVAGSLLAAAAGAGLAAVAVTLLLAARPARSSAESTLASGQDAARAEIRSALGRLPIQPEHLERPGDPLVRALARVQTLLLDRAQRIRGAQDARERAGRVDEEARSLAAALDVPAPNGATPPLAEELAQTLDLAVRRSERLEHAAEAAEREARRLDSERATVRARLDALAPELDGLRAAGEALAPGDPRAGLREALRRWAAHRRADDLEEELEQAHPDLADLEARVEAEAEAGGGPALDDDQLAVARARIERLDEEIERLLKRSEAFARDAEHLRSLETVDAVDSEIASLTEEQARLARERDRKWILAKMLREADRRFREEHQPDLLRRAGSYLRHLTGGRYERLVVDEGADGDLFQVVGPGLPAPIALTPPVSTGTLEQAYLSLRLAIVDHLDQGGERLPLFIDEVFVNWDSDRRARGLEVVAKLSQSRQVFVFTCHEGLAADLERRGARVLPLGAR